MRSRLPVLGLVLLAAASVGAGQEPASGAPGAGDVPEIAAGTEVVALQVVVSDARGGSVGDLTAEDFVVEEEGKRRRIVAFQAIDATRPPAPGTGSAALAAVSKRQYLLLFDLSFSDPGGLVRAREAATQFVDGLPSGDLVAVGTVSVDSGATLLVNLTTDRRQVRRAIDTLGLGRFQRHPDPLRMAVDLGADTVLSRDELTGRLRSSGPEPGEGGPGRGQLREWLRDMMVVFRRSQRDEYVRKVGGWLDGLKALGHALDWVSGRKEVVLLSSGFDPAPLVGGDAGERRQASEAITTGRLWEVDSDAYFGSASARDELRDVTEEFGSSHAVIHTVDVSGLVAGGDASSLAGESPRGAGRETLAQIANASGGEFISNTNDVAGALCGLAEGTRRFYAIAFEPSPGGDPGDFRKIEVKVARKGLRVSHRRGYRIPDPEETRNPMARQLRAAEAIAKGLSGGDFELRGMALAHREEDGRLTLPVTIEVDAKDLFEGRRSVAEVEVYGYALDARGGVQDALVFRGMVDRTALANEDEPLQVKTAFEVQPGVHEVRLVMREAQSGRVGTRSLNVDVPAFAEQEPLLYPPLLMQTLDEANGVQAPSMRHREAGTPFQVSGREFGVSLDPELRRSRTQRLCVMYWPGEGPYSSRATFDLGVELLGPDGPLPFGVELAQASEESDGFRRYVLAATPGEVPDGDYTLEVRVVDPLTGSESVSQRRVRIRE